MPNNEYTKFITWVKAVFGIVPRILTPESYKQSVEYNRWVGAGKPVASEMGRPVGEIPPEFTVPSWQWGQPPPTWEAERLTSFSEPTPTAPAEEPSTTSPTPARTDLIDPVDYVFWYRKILLEDKDIDKSLVPQMVSDMQARINADGFNEFYEGYEQAKAYIDGLGGRGETWVANWQDSGRSAIVDKYGNLVQLLEKTPTDEMTDYEAAQIGLSKEQLELQREDMKARANQSELDLALRLAGLGEEGWIERFYAKQAQQAEKVSKPWYTEGGGLAGIAGWKGMAPEERGDWISRYEKSQWAKIDPTIQERMLAGYGLPSPPPGESISLGDPHEGSWGLIEKPVGEYTSTTTAAERAALVEGRMTKPVVGLEELPPPFPVGEAPPRESRAKPKPRPKTPPTPAWLPQFAPWLAEGQPISRGQMPTPSGQLWGRTTPSVKAGLKGFTKWKGAGRSLEDIYAHMLQMQPQAPRGAGYQRWLPQRQR